MTLSIAYLTAGAAGMYCGSCMHDNTLASALHKLGVDVQLIPTYTPIRTDEQDVSVDHVAFGGVNVYLQENMPLFRYLPRWIDGLLDRPSLIRWFSQGSIQIDPAKLGALTVSMLQGTAGHQRKEVRKLVDWLAGQTRPDLIVLSNVLIAGCVPALKQALGVPALVTLQGDDIFLDSLQPPYKQRAFDEIHRLIEQIDGFVVFNRYYAEFMGHYLGIPAEKIRVAPLGIDVSDFPEPVHVERPPTVGFLARLSPEKGLHRLIDAFLLLRRRRGMEDARLHVAGWQGESNKSYAAEQFHRLTSAAIEGSLYHAGSVDRAGKIEFLRGIDVLSVPTVYHDPKGLFVLEALAAGVPVVQPSHGAFPELIAETGGGRLVRPGDAEHLAETLHELLKNQTLRWHLGLQGREVVHSRFNAQATAQATLEVYRSFLGQPREAQGRHGQASELARAE
jgi:glycosyltransferase involved in cell wall biosynthesis